MSTLPGVSSKGEKGKSKFQSLDINSLYNKTSRGESSEPHTQKSTVPRKHGMQSLGKVPSARRPPANLPSLKSEHSGNDPTVSLVPTGGTGWGSKPGETGPSPTTQPPPQTTAASSINHSLGASAPAAVGTPAPQTNTISQPPTQGQVNVQQKGGSSSTSGGDKTWSSVMSGGETGPSFLAHQSPQFQQEFPSLSGEAAAPAPPVKGPIGQEGQYGPGPSLRPQTEGSWIQGGGTRAPPPVTTSNTTTSPPQHPFLPQESVSGGNRNNLGQFGSGTVPGGPPPQQPPQIPSQFKGVVPPFMLNRAGGFPNMFPPNFNSPPVRPRFHAPPENRFVQGSRPPPLADPEDLIPRPIIREEDLNRMDEISRDTGWATQDDIDYNQKLAFSDDESAGPEDCKDTAKDINNKSSSPSLAKEEKDLENEKEPNEKQNDRLSAPNDKQQPSQPWQGRGPPALPSSDFRGQLSRPSSHPVPITPRVVDAIEEHWKEKRRQVSEKVAAVTEKAKQRKEEEEKRFEESRSKSHLELEQKSKKGKEDVHGIEQHPGTANISEWEKDSMPAQQVRENKDAVENFRQMTQLDSRPNFNREKERDRDMRGERDVQTFQRFQSNLPPRFQKQMNDRPGSQQYMRQSPNNVTNSMQSFESRWSITNSHNTSHFSGKQTNNTGRRNDSEITDRDIDRDRMKENDDKDRRERLTPEETIERERREREELEWEGRRGNSSWDHNRHYDDKYQGRRDSKKSSNDAYSNKSHKFLFEERENEWRDRPQRPESRERPDRPPRPDSRDSRASRDSRNSRESMRDESRAIPELMNNDYPWADIEYEKDIREEKPRKKENYKDEKRENVPRREGHVPGPITREKMEAYEHKQNLAKAEKKEVIGGTNNIANSGGDDDARNKLQSSTAPSVGGTNSNTVSWADSTEEGGSAPSNQTKDTEQQALQASRAHDDVNEKNVSSKETLGEKKKENIVKEKDKSSRGGRGGRGGNRTSGNYPAGSNYGSVFYRGSGSSWNSKESRRSSNKSGSQKQGQWNASESEASADEVSASTESGKEDKKTERKQIPRSPRPGERKRDKEDRIRESKKNENDKNRQDKKQQSNVGQGSGYESGGGSRKEGFAPRGEPSRRGRGGYRTTRGNLGNVAGHYGPPGNKSPFPSHGQHDAKQEDDTQAQPSGGQSAAVSDLDSSTGDDKTKQKQQIHVQPPATGIRQNKDNINSRVGKNKSNNRKGGSGGEEWETTSEASDSESKNLKHSKIQQKLDKSKLQRPVGDKRGQFSTAHMNGRPSRSEDGKDNGFQEVRSKKVGKESRPLGKEEPKRGRGKEGKGKGLQGSNSSAKAVQSKSYTREWSNNKPPRLQRLENNRKQQHQQQQQEVSEMNKINQNVTALFPIRDVVTCSAGAPPPPPSVNAWDKPITATLRTTPPPANNPLHLASTIPNSQDKSAIDLNEHGQSAASSQTSSPSAEKALTKMSRDAVEKALLDGTTPPVQTIIFENTNYKVPSEMAMKAKYSSLKGQRIDKARGKLEEDLEGSSHGIGLGGFKPGSEMKQGDNKSQEPIQISMSFSKNEDNADMKLDFAFDSDLSQLTEDKTNIPRSIHLGQTSAADLNQKIASVKKVWETAGAVMEHQHHVDENHGVVSTSSSFTPNFGSAVDAALDHSAAHQVDDSSFTNSDVYSAGPTIQANSGAYSSGGANIIKQDPNSASTNVKPQPQQTTVMSSGIGTHSAPSLSSPPPAFTQQGHFNYQAQYSNMPAIPSPPAVLINSATGAQQVNHQGELFHSFPLGGPTVIGNQAAARSGFSQYAYSLSQGLGQTSAAAFSQQSLYHHLPQPAAPPPPPNAPPDVFSSLSQYRIQPSAYGQSQQLSNNPSTVLITSSSNSLMSASVKSSPQPPIGAPIGTKGGYQSSAHPSQVQLGFIQYETQMLPQNFLQNSQLVQQRHGGSNVVPAIQPPTSYYSSSAGGQTGLFQPGNSILASTGNQPGLHSAATAFGMQGFGTQSAGNPAAAPSSTNPVGVPSFTTQMGHFRAPAPATYLKAGNPSGQHPSDASKSPSNNQDVLSVFTTGGGQIPSPKSRATGAATGGGSGGGAGSATSAGGTTKQVGPSPASQQPSPTQSHHKFSSYQSQQNLVLQQQASSQSNRGGPQMNSGGVRNSAGTTASGGGSASSGSLSANGVLRYPNPIQRPVDLHQYQQQQQQQMMQQVAVAAAAASAVTQPRHNRLSSSRQQHIKIANQYYPQQGNPVKLDGPGLVEGKTDTDKLQENNTSTSKQDKGKEEASTNKEQ